MKNEQNNSNKTNKNVIIGVVVAVAIVAIVVCIFAFGQKNIAGTYSLVEMTEGETNYSREDIQKVEGLGLSAKLELKEDKTGTLNIFGQSIEITYDDNNLISEGSPLPYKVEGNTIILERDGDRMVFEKNQ